MSGEIAGNPTLLYLILGLLAGVLGATFGVGGGILMVPALTLLASMPQKEAQGVSLTVMIVLAVMGAIRYHMNPDIHIDYRVVAIMSVTMVIGANIGASIAGYLSGKTLQIGFAILLFIIGVRMIWSALKTPS
ncbi:MAG: sulfite exporter TauE/SafE family protein [Candidatus Hinthialibacter sp.]